MKLDLDAIEARAKAATPGPWFAIEGEHDSCEREGELTCEGITLSDGITYIVKTDGGHYPPDMGNAAHIAGLSPDVALALVARIRELELCVRAVLWEP